MIRLSTDKSLTEKQQLLKDIICHEMEFEKDADIIAALKSTLRDLQVVDELTGEGIRVIDDEEFIITELVPVINEMLRRNICGYSDGEYQYRIVKNKEEE